VARANYNEIISGRGTEHGGVWLEGEDSGIAFVIIPSLLTNNLCRINPAELIMTFDYGPTI
jgi:hypothetical protein